MSEPPERLRIDKWLWVARFFKTRSLATTAVEGGKVQVGGERVKPSRPVRVGDTLVIRIGPYEWSIVMLGVSERRGPAPEARLLYQESDESRTRRESLAVQIRASMPTNPLHKGRPTKKDRRDITHFEQGEE